MFADIYLSMLDRYMDISIYLSTYLCMYSIESQVISHFCNRKSFLILSVIFQTKLYSFRQFFSTGVSGYDEVILGDFDYIFFIIESL